jgi:methyl-accepting chemotaxis protein
MKIGKKLVIMIISLNLAGTGIIVGTILSLTQKQISGLITDAITTLAKQNANKIEIWFERHLEDLRTAAHFMERYEEVEISRRREIFTLFMRTMVESNPNAAAAGSCWEPNVLDGTDARYANTPGTDGTGRFIPYWSRTKNGITLDSLKNYETPGIGNYYVISKQMGHETLIEPYWYPIDGHNRLITTLTVPIKKQNRFIGAVLVDIDISIIQEMTQGIRPYEGSVAVLFSNGGMVSGHNDPERIGKSISQTERDIVGGYLPELTDAIRMGREYHFSNTIQGKGEMQFISVPITVGATATPWTLMIGIPTHIVKTPIYHMLIIGCIIGVMMLLIITAGAFIMARSISRPLAQMVTVLKDVGEGDMTRHLNLQSRDEIGVMTTSFNGTIEKIRELILIIKDKTSSLSNIGTDLSSNMTETAAAVNEITANIKNIKIQAAKQNTGVGEASAVMQTIITHINELNSEIDQQSESVSQSSSAIEELLANIESVTQTLINNTGNVRDLAEASEVGRLGLQEVVSDIREIAHESEGLLKINGVMENIASQTNLLSMNAAIEAAHAGETGKGFAVVAGEIRKLAESAGEQSKTISTVLKKIKGAIDKITRSADEVLKKFEAIDAGVRIVSQQEENIRNAMEEQGVGSKQILAAVGRMNEITGDVKAGSKNMLLGGKEILKTSKTLEAITQELTNGMNEMAIGADEINVAVGKVNDLSGQNKNDIQELIAQVDKFKIN